LVAFIYIVTKHGGSCAAQITLSLSLSSSALFSSALGDQEQFRCKLTGDSLTIGIRAGWYRWGDGGEWFKVPGVTAAATPGTLAAEEGTGWRAACLRMGCQKGCVVGPANYSALTKTNYNQWVLLMRIKLEARGLWAAVELGDVEFQVDRMALDAICSAVPQEMVTMLATKQMTMEARESLKMMHIGDERVRVHRN
jgi:hypothetical protein